MFKAKHWFLLLALVTLGVLLVVFAQTPTIEHEGDLVESAVSDTPVEATDLAVPTVDGGVVTPTKSPAPTTELATVPPSTPSVLLPYSTILLEHTYNVGWTSTVGNVASLVLMKGGEQVGTIPGCTDMPVRPSVVQYCPWQSEPVVVEEGATGFTLRLLVKDTSGKVVQQTTSHALSFVPGTRMALVPFKDTMYGWNIRYPEAWYKKEGTTQMTFAKDAKGLIKPLESREAFTVEYCATVYEACLTRLEEFRAVPGTREASLGGKRSEMHTQPGGAGYIREDLFLRSGIAFFITRRAEDALGTVVSPFVRDSIAAFGYGSARTYVTSYELDEHFRAGNILLKYVDSKVTYARITTGALGCIGEIETASLIDTSLRVFKFSKDSCIIDATEIEKGVLDVNEERCDAFRGDGCGFDGTYRLTD